MGLFPWREVGYDESNHGKYPEICVAVSSQINSDPIYSKAVSGKIRKDHSNILRKLNKNLVVNEITAL